jgi:hypothetical protein
MKKFESEKENNTERAITENIENVTIFPCLLVIPKVLDDEEFLHYLKETKKRSTDSDSKP